MQFSANLGFLWTEHSLPEAIRRAGAAGFDAVEFHWPYDVAVAEVQAALTDAGLPVVGLNTRRGDVAAGENGLAAVPGREVEARAGIVEAIVYGGAIGARDVHVMAGKSSGAAAHACFVENLRYACGAAAKVGLGVVIEPLNSFDAPDYFLRQTDQAAGVIAEVAEPNLSLMFDCYHVARTEGDVIARLEAMMPLIGHIQFAGVPDRGDPLQGTVDYREVFAAISRLGFTGPLGAEYRPEGTTEDSLGWMQTLR